MTPRNALLLVFGVVAVSVSAPLIRLADAPPLAIAFYRNALAAALLLPIALTRGRRELRTITAGQWGGLVLAGTFLALHFAAFVPAVTLTSVAAATVLVNTQPVWAAIGARVFLAERLRGLTIAGIAIALAGAVLISGGDFTSSSRAFLGDVLAVAGAIAVAVYLLAGGVLRQRLSLVVYAAVVYTICALLLLVAALASGTPLAGFPPEAWLMFALMALGPQIGGHTTFNYLLRDLDATVVAVAVMAEPVGASLLALALFGEAPSLLAIAGGAVILVGVYLAITAESRRRLVAPVEEPG